MDKIRVLVVDDSALVRRIISDALERDPEIEVVGTANNGKTAVFKSYVLYPDVITMDVEMPIMNGLDALKEIMQKNAKPVIMLSSLTQHGADATFKALEYGAVDFVPKPQSMVSMSVDELSDVLINKVKAVARTEINYSSKVESREESSAEESSMIAPIVLNGAEKNVKTGPKVGASNKIVLLGTSTGGPSALIEVFKKFPTGFSAPVLVVQHMPEGFTKAFAERLDKISVLSVKEAEDGDVITPGCAYVAPGHSHMVINQCKHHYCVGLHKGEKVSGHRPSIDELFNSATKHFGQDIIAGIMTGMGKDGSSGILNIKNSGGYTFAQDKESSVVFGMNRVAVEIGAIKNVVPLQEITKKIVEHL